MSILSVRVLPSVPVVTALLGSSNASSGLLSWSETCFTSSSSGCCCYKSSGWLLSSKLGDSVPWTRAISESCFYSDLDGKASAVSNECSTSNRFSSFFMPVLLHIWPSFLGLALVGSGSWLVTDSTNRYMRTRSLSPFLRSRFFKGLKAVLGVVEELYEVQLVESLVDWFYFPTALFTLSDRTDDFLFTSCFEFALVKAFLVLQGFVTFVAGN